MRVDALLNFKNNEMTPSPMAEKNIGPDFRTKLIVIACATLILTSSLIVSVCAVLQLKEIQEEVANLRWEIEQLKLGGMVDSELINDLKRFENEELYQEDNMDSFMPNHHLDDDDLFESDYDIDYENFTLLDSDEEDISSPSNTDISLLVGQKNNAAAEIRAKRETTSISKLNDTLSKKNETNESKKVSRKRRAKAATKLHQWEPIGEDATVEDSPEPRRRNRHRQKNNIEIFDEKPRTVHIRSSPVIQLVGDTSKYVMGQHTNYNGNGHLRHLHSTYVDWVTNDWVKSANMDKHFEVDSGIVKVKESGIYFVYAQIFYLDEHDTNGYRVFRNKEVFLQCTTMTHSLERVIKSNTCYTGGLSILNEGDEVYVQDLGTGRYSIFEPGKSFFGLIKVADVKVK